MCDPKLYLAFQRAEHGPRNAFEAWQLCVIGPFAHSELVIEWQRVVTRYVVGPASTRHDNSVRYIETRFKDLDRWVFLKVPCTEDQLTLIYFTIKAIAKRGDKFSPLRMVRLLCKRRRLTTKD